MRFTRYFSEKKQSYYWYNDSIKKFYYEKPEEIIKKEKEFNNDINDYWTKKISKKEKNKNYWVNERTGEYSWVDPSKFSDELKPIQEKNHKLSNKQKLIERTKKLRRLRELEKKEKAKENNNLGKDLTTVFSELNISDNSESEKKESPKLVKNLKETDTQKIPNIRKQTNVKQDNDDNEIMAVNGYGMACSIKGRTREEQLESLQDLNEALRDMYRR